MKQIGLTVLLSLFFTSGFTQTSNYAEDEVIVRLNFRLLNKDLIDDKEVYIIQIKDFLNEDGLDLLSSLPEKSFNLESLYARKMFLTLSTTDTVSIGRQGQKVYVPPFWATFKLAVPDHLRVKQFCSDLEDLYPLVIYAHPNFKVETTNVDIPDDAEFPDQISLHPDNGQLNHISIDSAWFIEKGEPWIKVGVFDTGIDSTHEDIDILTGWNYLSPYTFTWGSCTTNDHGMKVAGIIGAKRDNNLGIAGIAGGDGSDSSGVSILDFKRYDENNSVQGIDYVATGIIDAARMTGTYYDWNVLASSNNYWATHAPGYGIHIGNHSYSYRINVGDKQEPNDGGGAGGPGWYEFCDLCRESFLFSLQNGVVSVVSRGNRSELSLGPYSTNEEGPVNLYPARYDDSWVISVSSSGVDGNRLIGGTNGNNDDYFGYYGGDVDLLAPGSQDIIRTTHSLQNPSSSDW